MNRQIMRPAANIRYEKRYTFPFETWANRQ